MFLTGVLQSFGMVFLLTIFFIMIRFASNLYSIEPITFTVISFVTTSMILALAAGPGKYAAKSLKSFDSWKYAFFLVALYISEVYLVKYVSGTELTILMNLSVPMSILISYMFLKRRHSKQDLLGMFLILLSGLLIIYIQSNENLNIVIFLTFITCLFNTLVYISSETHDQSNAANRDGIFRDKIRVVAFVSFLSAMMFLIIAVMTSYLKTYYFSESINKYISFVPDINHFVNLPTVILGILVGTFIAPVNRYLKWSASYKIKAENVLFILAFTPIFTMLFEWILSFIPHFQSNLYIFDGKRGAILSFVVILGTLGAGLPIFIKVAKNYLQNNKKGNLTFKEQLLKACNFDADGFVIHIADGNSQDYEVILATFAHCQKDLKRTAELLEIPEETVKIIYDGQGDYCLNDENSLLINKNFRERVVLSDPLTGLSNRTAMLTSLKKLYNEGKEFSLVFIDLNKFKQINDTYGHDAGDKALIEVGAILKNFLEGKCLGARFAGDEFCLILPFNPENSIKVLEELRKELTKTIQVEKGIFELEASFGIANSCDYKTASLLLNAADELMYKEKHKNK